jgi:large subunit GTPase 1
VRELLAKLTPQEGQVKVGFVGYPNVGKSSLINVLCGRKRVGVTSTPGKTKHLQTVPLNDKITLFDCPGLVFPSFVSSRAEMVTCGVLPIDNLTDFMSPIELLCSRVPSSVFEQTYGLKLGGRVPASYLLSALSTERGYYNGAGLPDQTKAARFILKDYVRGKLLYCHLPPGNEAESEPLADLNTLEENQKLVDSGFFKPTESPRLNFDADGGVTLHANFKLTKQEKRELKFSYKRGEDINAKLQEIGQKKQGGAGFVIKSKKQ